MNLEAAIQDAFNPSVDPNDQRIALRRIATGRTTPQAPDEMRVGARRELRRRVSVPEWRQMR